MRVLLDECVPRRLKADLRDHEVRTVQEEGWASLKNGELLRAATGRFDVLLTVDRSIPFQQNLRGLTIGILAMVVTSNRLADIRPLISKVRAALPNVRAGEVKRVGG